LIKPEFNKKEMAELILVLSLRLKEIVLDLNLIYMAVLFI